MIDAFRFSPDGIVAGLYTDTIDLRLLGHVRASRASRVEWDEAAQAWMATLAATGKRLGPFQTRAGAVDAERRVLAQRLADAFPGRPCPVYFRLRESRRTEPFYPLLSDGLPGTLGT